MQPGPSRPKPLVAIIASGIIAAGIIAALMLAAKPLPKVPAAPLPDGSSPVPAADETPSRPTAGPFSDAYVEPVVDIRPSVAPYKASPDLRDVAYADDHGFSPEAKALLAKNSFVVRPGYSREFFMLYENNRYNSVPSFVTTDSMLHNYHLVFDHLLRRIEEDRLIAELERLNKGMLAEAGAQLRALAGTDWQNAARRNLAFFAVGAKLLDPASEPPAEVADLVAAELELIDAREGISESPVMNLGTMRGPVIDSPQGALGLDAYKEDYSQYQPRGHYTKSDRLRAYFRSMMWYGRMTFRFKEADEIRSAALVTLALGGGANRSSWEAIYEPTTFFVGVSDDVTHRQMKELIDRVYGPGATAEALAASPSKFPALVDATKELEPPRINSVPVFNAALQPDREKEIKGFRFMGQRFTVDASVFQRLVDREVPTRMLPKGLDIPAAFGSDEALAILEAAGETKYENYGDNMTKLRSHLSGLPPKAWVENLYWGWLHGLRSLLDERPEGYPPFMRNAAWTRKDLNAFLGSWTELKHDTILYAKQVYAELGGGPGPEAKDDRGYVEPNPVLFGRLAALLAMTRGGLEARGLLSEAMDENLGRMETLALSLKAIAEKELAGAELADADHELIRSYGGQLEHFWLEINREEMEAAGLDTRNFLDQNPAALVADVATDPNGAVLEEATGHVNEIFVIVPVAGKLRIAKGGVYSYFEFPWPLDDRLTDEKWREMLDGGRVPEPPEWTKAFLSE